MIRLTLTQAAQTLFTEHAGADVEFHGVSTDTRTLEAGNLFVALEGPNFNGHDFVDEACARGAAALMLSRAVPNDLPMLMVEDTRLALASLAASWRRRFHIPVIAVTGSNGKTTVKEMIAAILQCCGPTLVTQGNLNNEIGLPLTLARLDETHRFAVIEMGASHPGEIAYLTAVTHPSIALITNAGPAHLEGFGSVAGVARAKGEIFAGLNADGVALINADDPHHALWRELSTHCRCLSFGLLASADISAHWDDLLHLHTPAGDVGVRFIMPGRHNVLNALAATAAALAAGASLEQIRQGLESMQPIKGRLQIKPGVHGARLIDDTYNANPASLKVALDVLASFATRKWLVLGDMAELGVASPGLHEEAGRQARALAIDRLFTVGDTSANATRVFGAGARHFATPEELIAALHEELATAGSCTPTLLVKGSRSARMEHVITALSQGNELMRAEEKPEISAEAHD